MKNFAVRGLAALLCIGGAIGIGISIYFAIRGFQSHWIYLVMFSLFTSVYVWAIITGIRLWRGDPRGMKWAKILFATQIPVFTFPGITYEWYTGLSMTLMRGHVEHTLSFDMGSGFNFYLDTRITDVAYGVNIVALVALVILYTVHFNPPLLVDPQAE
jgi:hypothetical protein